MSAASEEFERSIQALFNEKDSIVILDLFLQYRINHVKELMDEIDKNRRK